MQHEKAPFWKKPIPVQTRIAKILTFFMPRNWILGKYVVQCITQLNLPFKVSAHKKYDFCYFWTCSNVLSAI
jgi:hypothetical protein